MPFLLFGVKWENDGLREILTRFFLSPAFWLEALPSGESMVRQLDFVFFISDKITYNVYKLEILFRHLTQRGKTMVRRGISLAFLSAQLSVHMRFRRRNRFFCYLAQHGKTMVRGGI
jgi:hypothetical protein